MHTKTTAQAFVIMKVKLAQVVQPLLAGALDHVRQEQAAVAEFGCIHMKADIACQAEIRTANRLAKGMTGTSSDVRYGTQCTKYHNTTFSTHAAATPH